MKLTFPQVKVIPFGLRSLKISVTGLFKMDEFPPQACKSFPPTPCIHISRFNTTPKGNNRSNTEHGTGGNSRPIGAFIFVFFATLTAKVIRTNINFDLSDLNFSF